MEGVLLNYDSLQLLICLFERSIAKAACIEGVHLMEPGWNRFL